MISTKKQRLKDFVERSIANYKESIDYSLISMIPNMQQQFINEKLYYLYKDAEKTGLRSTLIQLKEVLDEYPGFSSYYSERENTFRS